MHTLARRQAAAATARYWHLFNLPSATDVARLRVQLGALNREVRQLTMQVEAMPPSAPDPKDTKPARRAPPKPDAQK